MRFFLSKTWRNWHAKKRGNAVTTTGDFDLVFPELPDRCLAASMACEMLDDAMSRHREEAEDPALFARLERFLPGRALDLEEEDRSKLAAELGKTRPELTHVIWALRRHHEQILRELVAETLDIDPGDPGAQAAITEELRYLGAALLPKSDPELLLPAENDIPVRPATAPESQACQALPWA